MRTVRETVSLPDSAEQTLVHPLDLADSRRAFAASWWLSVLTMPAVVFFLAALLWIVSNNYVTPIAVPIAMAVCAGLLSAYLGKEAWAYIPRKRQDQQRKVSTSWSMTRSAISTVSLLAGLVLLTLWLVDRELDPSVLGYILGSACAIVAVMLIELLWTALAPARLRASLDGWAPQVTRLVAVAAAVTIGCLILGERYDLADFAISNILIGAGVILAVQVIWWCVSLWRFRKVASRATITHH